jgi:hypothetical protein
MRYNRNIYKNAPRNILKMKNGGKGTGRHSDGIYKNCRTFRDHTSKCLMMGDDYSKELSINSIKNAKMGGRQGGGVEMG